MNTRKTVFLTGSTLFALLLSFSINLMADNEVSVYRDNAENIQSNKGIELLLYKKMTDAKTEHFSLRNTNSFPVKNINGVINYTTMEGEVFHSREFTIDAQIAAGGAKLTSLESFDQKGEYSFHMNFDPRGVPPGVIPYMIDIRILSFESIR